MKQCDVNFRKLGRDWVRYATEWSITASNHELLGHYTWMASQIEGRKRVLEIGTGDGSGTLELLRRGHIVTTVDENLACLMLARDRIKEACFPCRCDLSRATYTDLTDGSLTDSSLSAEEIVRAEIARLEAGVESVGYPEQDDRFFILTFRDPAPDDGGHGATLVHGYFGDCPAIDQQRDPSLLRWLSKMRFDAIICWNIGTRLNADLNVLDGARSAEQYRSLLHLDICYLAETVLATDGVIQLIYRSLGELSEAEVAGYRAHLETLYGSALVVRELRVLPYEVELNSRTHGVGYRGRSDEPERPSRLTLISEIFCKRQKSQ